MASAAKVFGAALAMQGRCEATPVPSQGRDERLCLLQALVMKSYGALIGASPPANTYDSTIVTRYRRRPKSP